MTEPQRITLMADWWPKACAAQGWKQGDRALRLRVFSEAVGRTLTTASELDSRGDIDKVKSHLGMLADNVQATIETDNPLMGDARRLREFIRTVQLRCLGVYVADPEAYMTSIIEDNRSKWRFSYVPQLEDLSAEPYSFEDRRTHKRVELPSHLKIVMIALGRAIQAKRKTAGHSLHDMKMLAGVKCECALCIKRTIRAEAQLQEGPF